MHPVRILQRSQQLGLFSSVYNATHGIISPGSIFHGMNKLEQFQPQVLSLGFVRYRFTKKVNLKHVKKVGDPDGRQYPGFVYFPRRPDDVDPPVEPSKLFMVKRIRSLYGCPWWEKEWMRKLNLIHFRDVAIIKNTPQNNKRLYRVKHLVEITPITTPNGMPDSPRNGFLKENGEVVPYNLLSQHGDIEFEEAVKLDDERNVKHMDKATLKARLLLRWNSRYDVVY